MAAREPAGSSIPAARGPLLKSDPPTEEMNCKSRAMCLSSAPSFKRRRRTQPADKLEMEKDEPTAKGKFIEAETSGMLLPCSLRPAERRRSIYVTAKETTNRLWPSPLSLGDGADGPAAERGNDESGLICIFRGSNEEWGRPGIAVTSQSEANR